MMKYIFLLIICLINTAFADEIKIEINPRKPVAGEVFQAYFKIQTDSNSTPVINFIPSGIEVVGKSNQGLSIRTVYENGRLTSSREVTIVYDLVASKAGISYMRDITAKIDGHVLRHSSVSVSVLKEAEEIATVFVMADVPKKEVYLGEGIVVRYYLYSKVPVSNLDIKKYPKLNGFLKRFLQEPERTERVSVDGQIYMRSQIYAAKLFPEKVGELKVDPLYVSATYPETRPGDPFGSFGFNRNLRNKSINSEMVKVMVLPLPEPKPADFTGLVGKHEFQLQVGKNKLIVNEPLEIRLSVTGIGALENMEAPVLIKHPGLEEFESNGDLKISDAKSATKTFDYTFLAKENFELPPKTITLSYLDPATGKYVSTALDFPEIVVAGGKAAAKKEDRPEEDKSSPTPKSEPKVTVNKEVLAPLAITAAGWRNWLPMINLGLGAIAILLALSWMIKNKGLPQVHFSKDVPAQFKKGNFELQEFVRWMSPLIQQTGRSPSEIIRQSSLPEESKRYFIDLLDSNDYKNYSVNKSAMQFKYQATHFKELGRYIESATHEDRS